ncbi:MAG: hypothetical protein D4R72_05960 [Nitrosopumilales archaeon]|nr:MAG: hypothetical protein D4R72_05960 [Nitrosopumilales archaeon]
MTTGFLVSGIMTASAEIASTNNQHCTTSNPCQKICGDHVCAAGEVYPPLSNSTKIQNATAIVSAITEMPMSQNTSENNTLQNMTSGISSIYDPNGTRMVSDSKMCLAGLDTCVMVKMLHASPIKQMNVGIGALDVSCKTDFQLVLKTINNLPACVSSSTANELVKRGWALSQYTMMKEKLMFEPNSQ